MKLDLFARTHQLSYHKSAINPIKPIFFLWFRNGFPSRSRKPQTAHLEVWVVSPTRAHLAPGRGLVQESYGTKTPLRRWWLRRWLLVGGAITILKHDGVRQWVSDDIPYMKWKIKNDPNHQPGEINPMTRDFTGNSLVFMEIVQPSKHRIVIVVEWAVRLRCPRHVWFAVGRLDQLCWSILVIQSGWWLIAADTLALSTPHEPTDS